MDIVEVARDPKNLCQVQGCNTAPTCLCGLIEDMADEIERLREELDDYKAVLSAYGIIHVSRNAALKEKE